MASQMSNGVATGGISGALTILVVMEAKRRGVTYEPEEAAALVTVVVTALHTLTSVFQYLVQFLPEPKTKTQLPVPEPDAQASTKADDQPETFK